MKVKGSVSLYDGAGWVQVSVYNGRVEKERDNLNYQSLLNAGRWKNSTVNQWFADEQFEAGYRRSHAAKPCVRVSLGDNRSLSHLNDLVVPQKLDKRI